MIKPLLASLLLLLVPPAFAQDAEPPVLTVEMPQEAIATDAAPAEQTPERPALMLDLSPTRRWGLMVQAGVRPDARGEVPPEEEARWRKALKTGLAAGEKLLSAGGLAEDAAQAAAQALINEGGLAYGGAIALDADGQLATAKAATDPETSPMGRGLGVGQCAVAATGGASPWSGTEIAEAICTRVREQNEKINTAARVVLDDAKAAGVAGGVIMIAPDGQMGWSFRTPIMIRAGKDSAGRERIAIFEDE